MYNIPFRDDRSGNYQNWPNQAQAQATARQTARVWLDISDDEDGSSIPQVPYKQPGPKPGPQITPPLDLSGNTKKTKQPESPLDLSVKTRKRHADTTDIDEAEVRAAHMAGSFAPKRMCMSQSDYLQGRRYSQEEKISHGGHGQTGYDQKQLINESQMRNKLLQQQQEKKYLASQKRGSPIAQTSPMSTAQQQFLGLQRHHQMTPQSSRTLTSQTSLYPIGFDPQKSQQQLHTHPNPPPQPKPIQKEQIIQQRKQMPYDSLSSPSSRSASANSTESVALQGFFEPTCKLTVNTGNPIPPVTEYRSRTPNKSHLEQVMMSSPNQTVFPLTRSRELIAAAASDQRSQNMFMHAQAQQYPPSSSGKIGRMEIVTRPPLAATELELMQQKQLEQRHLQQMQRSQRDHMADKMAYMAQINQQKMIQDRQKILMKQAESTAVQLPPQNKSSLSSYSQKLHATYTQGSGHNCPRADETGFSSGRYIRASQPVPLSDISKQQIAQEQPQVIQNQHNLFTMQASPENARFAGYRHGNTMTTTANTHERSRQFQSQMSERERRYHIAESASRSIPAADRLDPLTAQSAYTHPSVIQRPAGFIPPRVVSGSGRQGFNGNSGGQQVEKMPEHALPVVSSMDSYTDKHRESLTLDNPFSDGAQLRPSQGLSSPRMGYYEKMKARQVQERIQSRMPETHHPVGREFRRSSSKELIMNKPDLRRDQHSNSSGSLQHGMSRMSEQRISQELSQGREKMKRSQLTPISQATPLHPSFHSQTPASTVTSSASQRSITKGTSGNSSSGQGMDLFSQLVLNELQKKSDDSSVNPFKNVSLLKEFDKSAYSSPTRSEDNTSRQKPEQTVNKTQETRISMPKSDTFKDPLPSPMTSSKHDTVSYTLPLQIAIPGSKPFVSSSRSSVISSTKQESSTMKNPKMMSRKHMILSAFKHDEDLKNSAGQDEKPIPEPPKTVSKRTDKEANPSCPASPKMPILSPQERGRPAPLVSPAIGGPPKLENPAASNASSTPNTSSVPAKQVFSLEEQLHKLISDAVKCSVNKDKESVYETVCRELTTQPQGPKVFLSRQLSQPRNIPVANVAPIVHGKVKSEPGNDDKEVDEKIDNDLDEEDEKMAEVVTMSLLGRAFDKKGESVQKTVDNKVGELKRSESQTHLKDSVGECSNSSANFSNIASESFFDENSDSKRMSPGLKKLMLYRHRDTSETSKDGLNSGGDDVKTSMFGDVTKSPEGEKEERNVFGAFSEILAQHSGVEEEVGEEDEGTCWPGLHQEDVEHQIHMVPNTDYDGDDEDCRLPPKIPLGRQSSVRQQADRLIKKAKHRRKSKEGKSPTRRKSRVLSKSETSPVRHARRKSSQETKTRQRRASSLDRETKSAKSRTKSKSSCFSDNELDHTENAERERNEPENSTADSRDIAWNQIDESTDEEYFQNYEDKFKKLKRRKSGEITLKKTPGPKRKRGFHFQQKYIFQRKRKTKGKSKFPVEVGNTFKEDLDEIYSFHEEGQDIQVLPFPATAPEYSNVPVPPELKRISINKDTGETLLHRAARMGYEEVALYCLATGQVEVDARDNTGYTALHECAVRGRVVIAKYLLKYGADVNCCSVDGIRPLHDAVENEQLEMVRLLLSYGADPTLSTYAGRSLIKIARTETMRNFLKAYVCDLNGHTLGSNDITWPFRKSSVVLEPEDSYGCAIFQDVPSDPEDESADMITSSAKPLFTTRRIIMDPGRRVEDYIFLEDILHGFGLTRTDVEALGLPSHLIKFIPGHGVLEAHTYSLFKEAYSHLSDHDQIAAVRLVDSTQLIARLEKSAAASSSSPSSSSSIAKRSKI